MGKTSQHELSYEVWRRVIRCMPHPPPPAGEGIIKGPFVESFTRSSASFPRF